jgi:hypothetical protein
MMTGIKNRVQDWPVPESAMTAIGGLLCGLAAACVGAIASGHPWAANVPLLFCPLLIVAAEVFGSRAGTLGTVLSALVFGSLLFQGNSNANGAYRANLAWMLLIGISFSFLFAPPSVKFRRPQRAPHTTGATRRAS